MEIRQTGGSSSGWLKMQLWRMGLLLCLCSCLFGAHVQAVAAQTAVPPAGESDADPPIQELRVQIMPEFDDPRVLVIVQGRLAIASADLPVSVTFRVPRGAQVNQMATIDMATGATTAQFFDAQPDPDDPRWSLVTYSLDNAHFFYEYYYDPIVGEVDKQFVFTFSSLQPVVNLLLEVQQPLAATNFTLTPASTIARFDEAFGFNYHQFNVGALEANGETEVAVSYTKTDPEPSLSREELMAMQTEDTLPESEMPSTAAAGQSGNTIPVGVSVLLMAVVVVFAGGFIWYRSQPGGASRTRVVSRASVSSDSCVQCGATLKAQASFCHVCGESCE